VLGFFDKIPAYSWFHIAPHGWYPLKKRHRLYEYRRSRTKPSTLTKRLLKLYGV
jgi:hypothetical protein